MLTEVQSEFVHLRDEARENRSELHQLIELQRKLAEMVESRLKLVGDNKPTASAQSNESWLHWIGRTTYVIGAYRYFVPKSD